MNRISGVLARPWAIAGMLGVVSLAVYLRTMVPTVGFIDSGELAAVAHTLGIAHPTGYPLFTLLGRIVLHLPFGGEEITRLNVLAAILTSAGVVFFFLASRLLVAQAVGTAGIRREFVTPAAAGGALLLAFSRTFWSQALAVEVYALHITMMGAVFYATARAMTGDGMGERWWYAAAFLLGLSFTNHMTTILLVPGLLYVYIAHGGYRKKAWTGLLRLVPFFLVGLSLYLYLPLRASAAPLLNWGDPSTLERLYWHVSGKQYRVWIFSSSDVAGKHLVEFITGLPSEFAVVGVLLAVVGLPVFWWSRREQAVASLLFVVLCVAYAVNYDIHDIESYYLLAYWWVGVWAVLGLAVAGSWWMTLSRRGRGIVAAVVVAVGCTPAVVHFPSVDQSDNYLVEDYTRTMFASFRPGALVLSYQWDYWVAASYYYQLVRGERPDLVVIDKELLRRSWYLSQLERRHPDVMALVKAEVAAFRQELYKFEHELPYDGAVIERRFVGMIRAIVEKGMEARPVYVTAEIEPEFTAGLLRVPEGLAFRVTRDPAYVPPAMPEHPVRPTKRRGRLEDMVSRLYGNAFLARGDYFLRRGELGEAKKAFRMGILRDPSSHPLRARISAIGG